MDDDGVVSCVGDGGEEVEGESDELVGPLELSPELEAGDLVEDDVGGFAGAPPPEDWEALGVVVAFFLSVVGAEAFGGEVGFCEPVAAGGGVGELLSPLGLGAPAGV